MTKNIVAAAKKIIKFINKLECLGNVFVEKFGRYT